ncbi:nuclear transport factor 2 family protein (plasmid) [Rhodococcus sp. ZPP]|uniref:nuclear transport factor 2 family protein n=1 Tax=Rhodococcus sp. ZPP TaxID=2749906 RepID=UPI001AD88D7B|nr:nuclear transport factor 2 family protein [Rhodococcus sp. ZPP]QTJ70712.1 nuclear transport factor 2 family protein [Rhodococcus sp. ZPP]
MPETHAINAIQPVNIVQAFYEAINQRNVEALGALIDESFADYAAVEFPSSLPYGGRLEGAQTLRKVFTGMAAGKAAVGPRTVTVEDIVCNGARAVALLRFDWYPPRSDQPVPSGACEIWRFEDMKVVEIRAYYWDTAALVAAMS